LSLRIARLADELDALRDAATAAEREVDGRKQAQALAEERLRSIAARREQTVSLRDQSQERLDEVRKRAEELAGRRQTLDEHVTEAQETVADARAALSALQKRNQEQTDRIRARQAHRRKLTDRMATLETEGRTASALEADLLEREARMEEQTRKAEERLAQIEAELAAAREASELAEEAVTVATRRLEAARTEQAQVGRLQREQQQKQGILAGAAAATQERARVLQELQSAHEGYAEGPRAVLQGGTEGRLTGVLGVVADHLEVPEGLEVAIEAGLAEELQWIVVDEVAAARAAIDFLRDGGLGRATFVAPRPLTDDLPATSVAKEAAPGVLGLARELVRYPDARAGLFARLLGSVVIVESLDVALAVSADLPPGGRAVTLTGEVVNAGGAITGGPAGGGVARALTRRRQLDELQTAIAELQEHLSGMAEAEKRLEAAGKAAAQRLAAGQSALDELKAEAAETRSRLMRSTDQAKSLRGSLRELTEDADRLAGKLTSARDRRAKAVAEAKLLRGEVEQVDADLVALRSETVSDQAMEAARQTLTQAQVRSAELVEQQRSTANTEAQYRQEAERLTGELAGAAKELEGLEAAAAQIRQTAAGDDGETEKLGAKATTLREQVGLRAGELSELREASARLDISRRQLSALREEQSERMYRLEASLAREEAQLEVIEQQLTDIYELSPEEALAQLPADFREQETRRRANELREAIRKLGPVNLSSIDEVERLRLREEFLSAQLDDLTRAQQDLLAIVAEIDQAANAAFLEAFAAVQVAFAEVFERLLGGGSTELLLTNPAAPLEGGVEVIVQLPGKRQQNLLLLSGGERALTALALLFAMIKIKPSPFCVMDEIDAALDANNTERFAQILRDFAKDSQFIVITHNPQTMVAADAHWGVTMQEPGVSMILPLELEEARERAEQITQDERRNTAPVGASRVLPTV
jgi:chromosome segregation protein